MAQTQSTDEAPTSQDHDEWQRVTEDVAYLCLYRVTRQYGGPEEGGWWYDQWEWDQVSIPMRCKITSQKMQVVEHTVSDVQKLEDQGYQVFDDEEHGDCYWMPEELAPLDAEFHAKMVEYLSDQYDVRRKDRRGSVLDTFGDYRIVMDHLPGYRAFGCRPRYC